MDVTKMTRQQMIEHLNQVSRQWGGPGLTDRPAVTDEWLRKTMRKMIREGEKLAQAQG